MNNYTIGKLLVLYKFFLSTKFTVKGLYSVNVLYVKLNYYNEFSTQNSFVREYYPLIKTHPTLNMLVM